MRINFLLPSQEVKTFEFHEDTEIENLINILVIEKLFERGTHNLYFQNKKLLIGYTISDFDLQNNDIVMIRTDKEHQQIQQQLKNRSQQQQQQQQQQSLQQNQNSYQTNQDKRITEMSEEEFKQQEINIAMDYYYEVQEKISLFQDLIEKNPTLAKMVEQGQQDLFVETLVNYAMKKRRQRIEEIRFQKSLIENPMNPEVQEKIMNQIQQKNIDENRDMAFQYSPELFVRVEMLYIPCEINNVPILAFVDSGAQSTIMTQACAKRCGITRLLDRRFQGTAVGVGSSKILGKIHLTKMKIGKTFFNTSITVLEQGGIDFLFGLDMLKRHRAHIDLENNVLKIRNESVKFLNSREMLKLGYSTDGFLSDHFKEKEKHENIDIKVIENKNEKGKETEKEEQNEGREKEKEKEKGGENQNQTKHSMEIENQNTSTNTNIRPTNTNSNTNNSFNNFRFNFDQMTQQVNQRNQNTVTNQNNQSPWEDKISKLVEEGYTRNEAFDALTYSNGNLEMAKNYLLSKMYNF
ncbi:aspartyl protease ddi-related [Anaeramoeba flamelloides]|uniref:Aspartyl protease ddi-related n=1 Tax=Anaeramoeba flamelloides TaxID=1746091 RepID=A0AAV7ZRU6_9EUKA|nr:aspartyl protease ddi-related [Anaeramoeba flamelloides]